MRPLLNNADLYGYLVSLTSELRKRGAAELSDVIAFASFQAPSMSTEFLGESRIALRHVLNKETGILTEGERKDIIEVLRQLDQALDNRSREGETPV
jgi:hypothetical protein